MKNSEILEMKGKLTIQKKSSDGEIIDIIQANNTIVETGRDLVAKLFLGEAISKIGYVGVGTGEGDTDLSDSKLKQEVYRVPIKVIQNLQEKLTIKDNKAHVTIKAELPDTVNKPDNADENWKDQPWELREAGLFNQQGINQGVMYNRVTFPTITKTNNFSLTLVWEIIF